MFNKLRLREDIIHVTLVYLMYVQRQNNEEYKNMYRAWLVAFAYLTADKYVFYIILAFTAYEMLT